MICLHSPRPSPYDQTIGHYLPSILPLGVLITDRHDDTIWQLKMSQEICVFGAFSTVLSYGYTLAIQAPALPRSCIRMRLMLSQPGGGSVIVPIKSKSKPRPESCNAFHIMGPFSRHAFSCFCSVPYYFLFLFPPSLLGRSSFPRNLTNT